MEMFFVENVQFYVAVHKYKYHFKRTVDVASNWKNAKLIFFMVSAGFRVQFPVLT
mgnify:CR=1 FL=1